MLKTVLLRFLKGFLAGGLAQTALVVNGGMTFHNLKDLGAIAAILVNAFIVGALLGGEKALNYTDPLNTSNLPPT